MAYTIPPDNRTTGGPNPASDMNSCADMLGLLTTIAAGFAGKPGNADPGSNAANVTAAQTLKTAAVIEAGLPPSGDTSGTTDTVSIQALASAGYTVTLFPNSIYYISAPLVFPPLTGLVCKGSSIAYYGGSTAMPLGGAILQVVGGFAGATVGGQAVKGVIVMVSQNLGGYATGSGNQKFQGITIDGRSAPTGVNGIEAWGPVWGVVLDQCGIYGLPNFGVMTSSSTPDGTGKAPDLWQVISTHIAANGSDGWNVTGGLSDSYFSLSESTANGGSGWNMTGSNQRWVGCKAEFNSLRGWDILAPGAGIGTWLTGCSTDHNNQEGVRITGTARNGPVSLDGCTLHGDGNVGGTGSTTIAGLSVTATTAIVLCSNLRVLTTSASTNSPYFGIKNSGGGTVAVNGGLIIGQNLSTTNTGGGAITLSATTLTNTGLWG